MGHFYLFCYYSRVLQTYTVFIDFPCLPIQCPLLQTYTNGFLGCITSTFCSSVSFSHCTPWENVVILRSLVLCVWLAIARLSVYTRLHVLAMISYFSQQTQLHNLTSKIHTHGVTGLFSASSQYMMKPLPMLYVTRLISHRNSLIRRV